MNKLLVIAGVFLLSFIYCPAQYPGQHAGQVSIPVKAAIKAWSFDLKDVRLFDSPFKENMDREGQWLLSLPNERLLHSFQVNAGMKTQKADSKTKMPVGLGGWEALDVELRGHSIGHILSGLAFQYASTGNEVFKKKEDSLVAGLAEVQQVLNEDGYLSAYPQHYIDRNIAGTAVWAPWYTLHKIVAGLIDSYWCTGNQQALDVVSKMAGWAYKKLSPLSPETIAKMLQNEFGGMNEAFYNLYSITGNPQHLKLAQLFYHHAVLDPLAQEQDKLNRLHANTVIPKISGEERGYELTGNETDKTIATFFWDDVIKNQTYAIGSNSDKEHFVEPGKLSKHITGYTGESCNTYNMLKVTRHLFDWYADAKYADYYEQALYNHILGQQDPSSGMVCYFTPMVSGAYKLYSTRDSSFWCCVGSGFESHSKYGEAIYYHDDRGVFVNLFIPSLLTWKEKGMVLRQETKYPEEASTRLTIESAPAGTVALYIRYPSWAVSGATITVNGKKLPVKQAPGSYITIDRQWKNGDKVVVTYPMSLRLVATPDNPNKAAIAYGPIVLAAPVGTEGMKAPAPFTDPDDPYEYYTYDYNIPKSIDDTLNTNNRKLADWVRSTGKPLEFKTINAGQHGEMLLKPYYSIHHERYIVYWDLK
ncbi:MAG TPA: beta-L-arabinofuranosidase domain-containing protein [Chitinophagaceae bacterium]|jgi:hypothetical protein